MTNLLSVLPDFDISPYTHILPSLERACVATADLLTLDALDVARRAQVPPAEVRKLTDALIPALHAEIFPGGDGNGLAGDGRSDSAADEETRSRVDAGRSLKGSCISTLDDDLDASLHGGILTGYVTEVVGESAVGKTQLLLTLLLSVQLPQGATTHHRSALYISTEAALQTNRLIQILKANPKLSNLPSSQRPSLNRIHSTQVHDLEAQEHILRYQVPAAAEKHDIGLVVIDSIAANYRAEEDRARKGADFLAERSKQLAQIGALLRDLARKFDLAVVVANQVGDRFVLANDPRTSFAAHQLTQSTQSTQSSHPTSRPSTPSRSPLEAPGGLPHIKASEYAFPTRSFDKVSRMRLSTDDPLSIIHQQRFFTGWGDDPLVSSNLKTPVLGLPWTNQLSARIALLKHPIYEDRPYGPGEERNQIAWRREFKVVFSAWCGECCVEYEIWEGGLRVLQMHA